MNHDNRHNNYGQQFGFDHYDLPPSRRGVLEKIVGEGIARKLSSPLVATAALLICGTAFAGIILASYPGGVGDDSIPVVKADTLAYKETPSDPGGMEIPNRDTTIFQTMADGDSNAKESAPVENLLANERPIDKLAAFQRQVEQISAEDEAKLKDKEQSKDAGSDSESEDTPVAENVADTSLEDGGPIALKKIVSKLEEPAQDKLAAVDIPDPMPPVAVGEAKEETPAPEEDVAEVTPKPEITHKAGENPETIEYVRSVLNKSAEEKVASAEPEKEIVKLKAPKATADKVSKVEPASGAATASKTISAGSYYIQLGSVSNQAGAAGEWAKLKKSYSQLASLEYRVQKADLAKGTFYRIQAGPISKDSAASICNSIKAQKPGACLVTK